MKALLASLLFLSACASGINAYAFPGGYIVITRGMVQFLAEGDQALFVLRHEECHYLLGHAGKRVTVREVEADLCAVDWLKNNGGDPLAAIRFFDSLISERAKAEIATRRAAILEHLQ